MSELTRRLPLPEVSDLIAPDEPLPFKVLDAQGRLLLAAGQCIHGPRQLAALPDACTAYGHRGAVVGTADGLAGRSAAARGAGGLDDERLDSPGCGRAWPNRSIRRTRSSSIRFAVTRGIPLCCRAAAASSTRRCCGPPKTTTSAPTAAARAYAIAAALPPNERTGPLRVLPEQVYGVLAPE